MISKCVDALYRIVMVAYIKHRCRGLMKQAGYLTSSSSSKWTCFQCHGCLDEVCLEKAVPTYSGEVLRIPSFIATMCPRCAWISDGANKVPIWKWLSSKNKGPNGKQFFLSHERSSLRMRLAEIENELHPRETLQFDDPFLRRKVIELKRSSKES